MESNVINLQEKIQKLIDQYTADRKRLEQLEEENNNLREENRQLMEQIENTKKFHSGSELKIKELENQVKLLQAQYKELQDSLAGLEEIASTTINQIDQLIPDLDNKK
ncbi:MAG TPA: hypothetical protein PK707_05135 [Candidatus Syntrophosphaera thermopropionivorans]|jgi:phage shock protein A|uniref:Uncharacterized protein n=1 Tax=Candidatus Syntrophosphaera thermopropionivorans TaxID=2593015 RepID=A0AC61QKC5_9BACT|nr:hypothetical protein [Candidatus Syntrophosphaera thermopropionivorans]MBP7932746.1 hypothetical protein [Candidatus Syntrophosphaera sp.]MBP9006400.1 hypothetical protein [Candidatus Syntrophosphaera sp.]TDF74137.1 hypothetical protein E0946_01535 [Candidatus Syntrophosphaera thermopropionivorans]HNU97717.1 hypothetical protein [Candidatus Syntrophosphaera thermopropionivorans]HNZ45174.1 hypothetical protein [Candidatus Syntrophosphaera thermopropionivorans]